VKNSTVFFLRYGVECVKTGVRLLPYYTKKKPICQVVAQKFCGSARMERILLKTLAFIFLL
jgi:hypothetical protein